ncbi:MAG: SLC13 family permease [Vulcanimicrobiaceae bacterium]
MQNSFAVLRPWPKAGLAPSLGYRARWMMTTILAPTIAVGTIAGMLARPWRLPEWVWALGGAAAMVLVGAVPLDGAWIAVGQGNEVYAFLAGIMVLSEIARQQGVFAWLVEGALRAANGSRSRLFSIVFGVGVGVTAVLSNDTTAVVLTPAVLTALARTDADPLPYLFACAFVAGAASFVLPISNPANLVVFDGRLPTLLSWVAFFAASAAVSIVLTYILLRVALRAGLQGGYTLTGEPAKLNRTGRVALIAVSVAAALLVLANALGIPIGIVAAGAGALALAVVTAVDRHTPRYVAHHASWGMIPLVAGLFVVVAGLNAAGALLWAERFFSFAASLTPSAGHVVVTVAVALACNLVNNLPIALFAGSAIRSVAVAPTLVHATLVAVDLGPNLSVMGSLATILWLTALRREGIRVTPWQFFRLGAVVTLPVLLLAVLTVR